MRPANLAVLAVTAASALTAAVPAQAVIGEAVAVVPQATVDGNEGIRTLVVGTEVFVGDLVESGPIGEAQLLFVDDTRLVVGPNSTLVIETYLLRNETTVSNLAINTVRGSFRFISGASPSDAYQISTPTATIGVRGTSIDIAVEEDLTEVLVYSGSAEVCDLAGTCTIVDAGCGLASVTPGQGVQASFSDPEKAEAIEEDFPYALNQDLLRPDFQVGTGTCLALLGVPPNLLIDPVAPGAIQQAAVGSPG